MLQDNQSAITLSTTGTHHKRSKHFGIEFDYFKESIANGEIKLRYMETGKMLADMLTKSLPRDHFIQFRDLMMGNEQAQKHFDNKR